MKKIVCLSIFIIFAWNCPSFAENCTVKGNMSSQIRFELEKNITTVPGVKKTILSFVVPPSFESPTFNQNIQGFDIKPFTQSDKQDNKY